MHSAFVDSFRKDGNDLIVEDGCKNIIRDSVKDFKKIYRLVIPKTVENISNHIVEELNLLREIIVDKDNPYYTSKDGILYDKKIEHVCLVPKKISGEIFVPDTVISLNQAFAHHNKITKIHLPESIQALNHYEFYYCNKLEYVNIPSKVKNLFSYTFSRCPALQTIEFSEGLTNIEINAIKKCPALKNLILPQSLVYVPPRAFVECSEVFENIVFKNKKLKIKEKWFCNNNQKFSALEKIVETAYPKQFDANLRNDAVKYASRLIVQNKNTDKEWNDKWINFIKKHKRDLYSDMVDNKDLLNICIENKMLNFDEIQLLIDLASRKGNIEVSSILLEYQNKNYSAEQCIAFKTKQICEDTTSISYLKKEWNYTKNDDDTIVLTNYKGININVYVPSVIGKYKVKKIGYGCFSPKGKYINDTQVAERYKIRSIVIPDGIEEIDGYAFYNCESLESLILPNTLKEIKGSYDKDFDTFYGFVYGCKNLKSLKIPSSVKVFGRGAFKDCEFIEHLEFEAKVMDDIAFDSFWNCQNLQSLNLPDGMTEIEGGYEDSYENYCGFLYGCYQIKDFRIPSTVKILKNGAFTNCKNLVNLTISENVEQIEDYAFYYSLGVENLYILSKSLILERESFAFSLGLQYIEFSDNVKEINTYSTRGDTYTNKGIFEDCRNLETIILSKNLEVIGDALFKGCSILKELEIPSSVKRIGKDAFRNCFSLESLDIPTGVTYIGERAFWGCSNLNSLKLPSGCMKEISGYNRNPSGLFSDTANSNVVLYGFLHGCPHIYDFKIPEGVTSIAINTFFLCSNIKHIELPSSIQTIGEAAFACCESLEDINISENVTEIGSRAFFNCTNLKLIYIPKSVISIEDDAFDWCSSSFKIEGEEGSYAQEYAKKKKITFLIK